MGEVVRFPRKIDNLKGTLQNCPAPVLDWIKDACAEIGYDQMVRDMIEDEQMERILRAVVNPSLRSNPTDADTR